MSKLEQFGLFTGVLGLCSDMIALGTFVLGFWTLQESGATSNTMANLFLAVTAFFIFYGWFMTSWMLIRRRYVTRRQTEILSLNNLIHNTIPGVGFLVSPIFVFWILSISNIYYSVDLYLPQARFEATRVAEIMLTPTRTTEPGNRQYTPTPIIPRPVEDIAYDMAGIRSTTIGLLLLGIIAYVFIGIAFIGTIYHLMPIIYSDMNINELVLSVPDTNTKSTGQTG